MIMKSHSPRLVTAEEAVAISNKAGTVEECFIAVEIAEEWWRQMPPIMRESHDVLFIRSTLYATLWTAGRLQGIREERAKRKEAKTA